MATVVNFGAGPAKLPEEVLSKVQNELIHYGDTNISVMEMSHRSNDYKKINDGCQQLVRDLLNVPNNYKILFMHGGGTGMFAAIPMNLMQRTGTADYVVTGSWSSKAAKEAAKFGKVNMVVPKTDKYTKIPDVKTWKLDPKASYVYICYNETVEGVEFHDTPDVGNVPLVADMSSDIMTKKLDISKFGIIYAGAQKNIGPAGVTLTIIREDLLGTAMQTTPSILDFTINAKENSLYNTPPCFAIYVMKEVFQWIINNGGVEEMENRAIKKSKMLYDIIDNSKGVFSNPIEANDRSCMNVTFRVFGENQEGKYEDLFLKGAQQLGLLQLKGHRSVGGIRASIYNAITIQHVEKLANYMKEFLKNHSN